MTVTIEFTVMDENITEDDLKNFIEFASKITDHSKDECIDICDIEIIDIES